MTGKTHRLIGISSALAYTISVIKPEYSPATVGAVLVGSYFGSLLPDIDQPAADLWDSLPFGHTASHIVDPFFKHRHISHSLLGLALATFGFYYLLSIFPEYWNINTHIVLFASVIAYGSHLLADMITIEGIPLLFPWHHMFGIPPKPLEGVRIQTGKWFENIVIFPIVNIWLWSMIIINLETIKKLLLK